MNNCTWTTLTINTEAFYLYTIELRIKGNYSPLNDLLLIKKTNEQIANGKSFFATFYTVPWTKIIWNKNQIDD